MKIFTEKRKEESKEIKPVDKESEDKAIVKTPKSPSELPRIPDNVKELVAVDAVSLGIREAGILHGVSKSETQRLMHETEAGKLALAEKAVEKYQIANLATAKLMQTLGLLNPHDIEKERDKITVINGLSQVLDRLDDGKDKDKDGRAVHLHLYAPTMKKEENYQVVEVG